MTKLLKLFPLLLVSAAIASATTTAIDVGTNVQDWSVTAEGTTGTPVYSGTTLCLSTTCQYNGTWMSGVTDAKFDGFWTAISKFYLPSDATSISFVINSLSADDRAVLELNGHAIAFVGILASGVSQATGKMQFSDGGSYTSESFSANGYSSTTNSDFILGGNNTLELIVNNTDGYPVTSSDELAVTSNTNALGNGNGDYTDVHLQGSVVLRTNTRTRTVKSSALWVWANWDGGILWKKGKPSSDSSVGEQP